MADGATQDRRAGQLLIASAMIALVLANSPLAHGWHELTHARVGPMFVGFGQASVHGAIADGAMALFFLLVGLEVKREWIEGRLAEREARRLPILAAVAGMAVPAAVYLAITQGAGAYRAGWAIPAATDIAFAVGILALLGPRAPPSLKLLLVTIAVIDDIGAVIIIALAYTRDLDVVALGAGLAILGAMAGLSMFRVRRLTPYLIGFVLLWLAMLASGVHPTVAGVLTALTVPIRDSSGKSPLRKLEHAIHPWVMFGVVPLFGLVSAGVSLSGGVAMLAEPLPLAVMLGLFVGKQIGVAGTIVLAVRAGLAPRPAGTSSAQLYGAALLCGIGFTMSLFIGALAFPGNAAAIDAAKIGTLAGSLLSGVVGYLVLRRAAMTACPPDDEAEAREIFASDEPSDDDQAATFTLRNLRDEG
ncbi:Na+/H+ antiporter NhaA [Sphingomonas sp.]|uniref:Na+/H+ antiporter NhaA n=1 Tax=Sphingomonas sp. TaxID=28214 RepID=UPI00286C6A55|nr:Na+/H+ antiporter NhaA [Sphingomonas sp.]